MNRTAVTLAILAATIPVAACAQATPPDRGRRPLPANNACDTGKVRKWYGKEATKAVRAEIEKETGAAKIRWLYTDSVVTMDYNPARLNVTMDHSGDVIRSARCG